MVYIKLFADHLPVWPRGLFHCVKSWFSCKGIKHICLFVQWLDVMCHQSILATSFRNQHDIAPEPMKESWIIDVNSPYKLIEELKTYPNSTKRKFIRTCSINQGWLSITMICLCLIHEYFSVEYRNLIGANRCPEQGVSWITQKKHRWQHNQILVYAHD